MQNLVRAPFVALGLEDKPWMRIGVTAVAAYAAISILKPAFAYDTKTGVARPFGFSGDVDANGVPATLLPPMITSVLIGSVAGLGFF